MIQPPDDRRAPLTPQLALRVALIGSFALAMFAIIFFRLWFLQVLNGQQYVAQAQTNQVRSIAIPAPRGDVLDQTGNILVDNTRALDVEISPADLPASLQNRLFTQPPGPDIELYHRLARVLGLSTKPQRCKVFQNGHDVIAMMQPIACVVAQGQSALPYQNVTVQTNVNPDVQYYIAERQSQYPGVRVDQVYERRYPLGSLAAQLFGTIGRINKFEVHDPRFAGASPNDVVGQSGLEWYYDRYLRGTDGQQKVQVNSLGQFTGNLPGIGPTPGHALKLSLNVNLQRVGQQALQQSLDSNYPANGGAFVAMNPQDGSIYAMGSLPTFDPNIFTRPVSKTQYDQLNNTSSNYPLINRAIMSAGPTGSTFKPITSTAALQSGQWSLADTYDDTGQFCFTASFCIHNAGHAANGVLDLVSALRVSDDVFFYNLGARTNVDPTSHPNGGPLQQWAHLYGIGRKTGVDLGGESAGNLPSPKWRAHVDQLELDCERGAGPYKGRKPSASCGIADGRPWSIGDNVNLAVGQGDVQVTPLQLATAYATIANGGTVVRPHVGAAVESADGTVLQRIDPPPARKLQIDQSYLGAIREGLHGAAQSPGGTSYDVMGTFPEQVYGKTGTAQYNGQQDYSWYACFVPASATSKPIVVVVWVEQGGFGAVAAAPVARQILSQWFFGTKGKYIAGSSRTL